MAGERSDQSDVAVAFDTYAAPLLDYCLWWAGDAGIAENAVHDAFVASAAGPTGPRSVRRSRAWLYAAARNGCLRALQRRGRVEPVTTCVAHDPAEPSARLEPRVRQAVSALPRTQQEIVELAHRHRLRHFEIIAVLGRPGRAVTRALTEVNGLLRARCGAGFRRALATPPPPAPEGLRRRVLMSVRRPDLTAFVSEQAAPFDRLGFPLPLDRAGTSRRKRRAGAALAAVTILATAATIQYGLVRQLSFSAPPDRAPAASVDAVATPKSPATPSSPAAEPAEVTVSIAVVRVLCDDQSWTARVIVSAVGATAPAATVTWWTAGVPSRAVTATPGDIADTYVVTIDGLPADRTIYLRGTLAAGQGLSIASVARPFASDCAAPSTGPPPYPQATQSRQDPPRPRAPHDRRGRPQNVE